MPIKKDKETAAKATAAPTVEEAMTASPATPENFGNAGDDLFAGLGMETLSGGVDTEGFSAFSEEMERLSQLPEVARAMKIHVIPVSSQQLLLPVLAMVADLKDQAVVYSLLIEGMMSSPLEPIRDVRRDMGGPQGTEIIIDRPTHRCYDNTLRNIVTNTVAAQLKIAPGKVIHQAHCVVPRTAKLTAPEVTRAFFDSANLALKNAIARDKIGGVTTAHLTNQAGVVNQRTQVHPGATKLNKIGLPIAADFTTTIELAKRDQNKNGWSSDVHTGQQKFNLAEVSAYIDFSIAGNVQQAQPMNPMQQPTVPGFVPVAVITEIAGLANNGYSIEDMRTQLLGIAAITGITSDHGWVRAFETSAGPKDAKPSIGLLGLEHDPFMITRQPQLGAVKVESAHYNEKLKEGVMTPKQVADLWCTPQVAVALDIELGGRLHWVQDIFVMASGHGEESGKRQAANAKIIAECDQLTKGIFSKKWNELNNGTLAPVVSNETVTTHLGTYSGKNSEPRDIRSLDYLTMLSQMPRDLDKVSEATAATIPGGCNAVTLTERRNMIEKLAGNCQFTGQAIRVFFARGFINTFVQSLIAAGVTFRTDDILGYIHNNQRVTMNYNLTDNIASTGLYQSNYQTMAAPGVPGGQYVNPLLI